MMADINCCPKVNINISNSGSWLLDKISEPSFDITQSGNVRKAVETES